MADEHQRVQERLQKGVDAMIAKISEQRIRPMQKKTYLKMASCFDGNASERDTEQCLGQATQASKIAGDIIQQEMSNFQNRVSRCFSDCNDIVRDKHRLTESSTQKDVDAAYKSMLPCANACVDKHLALLKSIQANIERDIDTKAVLK